MVHSAARVHDDNPAELIGGDRNETDGERFQLEVAKLLVARKIVSLTGLANALNARAEWGSSLQQNLIGQGNVRPVDYYRAVADVYGLPFVDLHAEPVDPELTQILDRADYAARGIIPWRKINGRLSIATIAVTKETFEWADSRFGADSYDFVITSPFDILWSTQTIFREWDSFFAREALFSWKPEHSAKETVTKPQKIVLWLMLAALIVALALAPMQTLVALMGVFTTLYTLTFVFKFFLTFVGASRKVDMEVTEEELATVADVDLPVYSVLIPMYKEAEVLPLITKSLIEMDYPASKLEVKLVLEEDDIETIEAAKALGLPGTFEIVRVPESYPKTKPKACNYALQFTRGEYVTIYDAEDQPEPDQLKKAVLAFRKGDARLACVQGRLNYFNRNENWLTRMFTLEYSQWFDFLLPGLDWLKVPIPLGGTSNHFRLDVLREVGAWDPYNVTEDADLGVRLAQEGYTVGVINSTTYEEANGVLPSWINQRSRWIKGYMQT